MTNGTDLFFSLPDTAIIRRIYVYLSARQEAVVSASAG